MLFEEKIIIHYTNEMKGIISQFDSNVILTESCCEKNTLSTSALIKHFESIDFLT